MRGNASSAHRPSTRSIRHRQVLRAIQPAARPLLFAVLRQAFELLFCPLADLAHVHLGLRCDLFAWEDNLAPEWTFLCLIPDEGSDTLNVFPLAAARDAAQAAIRPHVDLERILDVKNGRR